METTSRRPTLLGAALLSASLLPGCVGSAPSPAGRPDLGGAPPPDLTSSAADLAEAPITPDDPRLANRQVNYGLALRTAAIKLLGDLPTLDEQRAIQIAPNPKEAYAARIDAYLADARFAPRMIAYFRDVFRLGGAGGDPKMPTSFETAPTFAARLVVEDRRFTEVLTGSSNTCPTYEKGEFKDGDCANGAPQTVGVLSDPGVQAQFVSNLGFRRVRWVQETFDCRRFPVEYSMAPIPMGAGNYSSPWPFESITGGVGAQVDFHDTKSVVCANCHSTMNHIAPLLANFDARGMWQKDIAVTVPVAGLPKAKRGDWIPDGEGTAWRFGVEVTDLASLGQTMASDPDVISCFAMRAYDYAMSKDDPVTDLATVPDSILAPYRAQLIASGYRMKAVLKAAFTSDDFVKF